MLAELILMSTMTWQITSYRSVPEQTDSTPFHTSIGLRVKKGFCAVSQDVLGKSVNYGDILFIQVPDKPELDRFCLVTDTMNKRHKNAVDIWVATRPEEAAIGLRRGYVYKLRQVYIANSYLSLKTTLKQNRKSINDLRSNYELQKSNKEKGRY